MVDNAMNRKERYRATKVAIGAIVVNVDLLDARTVLVVLGKTSIVGPVPRINV